VLFIPLILTQLIHQTIYALEKLQLKKNIKLLHVSAQGAFLREFLKKTPEKGTSVSRHVGLNTCHEFYFIGPLSAKLNPICYLLAFLGTHNILYFSRVRVNCVF